MKNSALPGVLTVIALIAFALVALAQQTEPAPPPMVSEEELEYLMPPPPGGGMGRGMGGRMGGAAIAVSGRDVYVVAGGMLLKYDSQLQLVAQAELPVVEIMRGEGRGRGPGRGRGMGGGGRGMGRGGGAGW